MSRFDAVPEGKSAMTKAFCLTASSDGVRGISGIRPATARPFDGDRHYRYLLLRAAFLVIP